MTPGKKFQERAKCKRGHCSPILKSKWCDLNSRGDFLNLRDRCPNSTYECLKQTNSTPGQFQLEGNGFAIKLQKIVTGTQKAWDRNLKRALT